MQKPARTLRPCLRAGFCNSGYVLETVQIREAKDPRIMSVREVKIEGITADDRDRRERDILGDLFVSEYFLAGPLVDARCARARAAQLRGTVPSFAVVRPFDGNLAVRFLDDLCRLDHAARATANARSLPFLGKTLR